MTQVVVARAVQGLGAGALFPLAMAIVAELVPPRDRGKWVAVPSSVLGVAAVLGPASGGWIADHLDWRWVFLSSLPLGLLALLVVVVTLRTPAVRAFDGRVDYIGAALLMSGCACVLLAATRTGAGHGWWTVDIAGLGAAGAALLVAFVLHERRAPDPMMPIPLFRSRLFVIANAVAFLSGTGMFVALVFVPLYVQAAMGRSATNSGVVLMPMLLSLTATSIVSGWIVARTGRYKWAIAGGPALMGLGFLVLVGVDAGAGTDGVALAMVLIGLGIGLLMQNLVLVLQEGAPARLLGAATGSSTFFRQVGGAFSVALAGGILVAGAAGGADPTAALTHASESARAAFADALQPIFLAGPPVMALGIVLALLLPTTPYHPQGGLT
jgi:MFS family permease